MEVLVFVVSAQLCALPLTAIVEVMRAQPIVSREGLPQGVLGTAIIRSQAIPVVDAGQLLLGNATARHRLLLLRVGEREVALAVDDIVGPRSILKRQLAPTPALLQGNAVVDSIAVLDSEVIHVLNSLRLLRDDPSMEECMTANHNAGAPSS